MSTPTLVRACLVVNAGEASVIQVDRVLASLVALPPAQSSRVVQTNALLGLGDGLRRARKSLSSLAEKPDAPAA